MSKSGVIQLKNIFTFPFKVNEDYFIQKDEKSTKVLERLDFK